MTIFQVISALFALFMMYVVSIHGKKKNLSRTEVWAWNSVWIGFIFIALFPHVLLGITGLLNFARVFDLLIVIAFMILSVVVFMSYFTVRTLQKKLEEAIRAEAVATGKKKADAK
ncbi:MAG: DUF2304 domain-containing protein [Pseudomonadales bacterium]|nr:DUF2304 domain-containing protein [Pseudomonadales bacterium]